VPMLPLFYVIELNLPGIEGSSCRANADNMQI